MVIAIITMEQEDLQEMLPSHTIGRLPRNRVHAPESPSASGLRPPSRCSRQHRPRQWIFADRGATVR